MDKLTGDLVLERPQFQIFTRGGAKFAIPADEIAAVADWRRPTPLPQAPPAVLGVVSIQGRMLTVLDPVVLLESSGNEAGPNGLIVALRGDEQLALLVDEKGETVTSESDQESQAANETGIGIIKRESETISILNVRKLFTSAMRGRERRQRRF